MRTGILSLVMLATVTVGCAHSGNGGYLVPPSRTDVATVTMATDTETQAGIHLATGIYWASMSPNRGNTLDVGAGYAWDLFVYQPPAGGAVAPTVSRRLQPSDEPDGLHVHGPFIEAGQRIGGSGHQRGWFGIKGELLFSNQEHGDGVGVGISARTSWELFHTVKDGGRGAYAIGALGAGVFCEAGVRSLPGGENAVQVTGGVSLRLPFAVGGK